MRTRAAPPTSRRENRHSARNTNAMKDLQYSLHLKKKSEKEKQCEQVSCTTSEDNAGSSDESSFGNNNKRKNKNTYIDDSSSSSNTSKLKATRISKKTKTGFCFRIFTKNRI